MKSQQKERRLAQRQAAAMDKTALDNADLAVWEKAANHYRASPDGGTRVGRSVSGTVPRGDIFYDSPY